MATDLCRIARPTRVEIALHADRQFGSATKFRQWNWSTVPRERAIRSLAGHYERLHLFDFACEPGLLDDIVDTQLSKYERP